MNRCDYTYRGQQCENEATETIPWLKGERFCSGCADEIRMDNAAQADFERRAYGGTRAELAQEAYDAMYPPLPEPWWNER